MKTSIKMLAVVSGAALLGGCQSFPLTSWMFKGERSGGEQAPQLAGNTAGALDEGKAFLRDGNIAAAIASFRIASLERATRADASNGLAVAYARLGRPDLAERYFRAAIVDDPDNPKYVANLLRLQHQTMLARQPAAFEAVADAGAVRSPEPGLAAAGRLSGPAVRVSRGEVHIGSREMSPAPAMAVIDRRAAAATELAEKPGGAEQIAAVTAVRAHPVTATFGE